MCNNNLKVMHLWLSTELRQAFYLANFILLETR